MTGTRGSERRFYPSLENLVESGVRSSRTLVEYTHQLRALAQRVSEGGSVPPASDVFSALSNPARLNMLGLLAKRELCVCELSFALRMTQPTTSHHLRILERAGLVASRPQGKWTFYRIADRRILRVVDDARRVGSRSRAVRSRTARVETQKDPVLACGDWSPDG